MKKRLKDLSKEQIQLATEKGRIIKDSEIGLAKEQIAVRNLAWIVAFTGVVLYINTLGNGYVLDDYSLIVNNADTKQGFGALVEIFKTSYRHGFIFAADNVYRPLSKAMFAIEWGLAPNNPLLGHWVNVLLYGVTGFFLTITLYKYFKSAGLAFINGLIRDC